MSCWKSCVERRSLQADTQQRHEETITFGEVWEGLVRVPQSSKINDVCDPYWRVVSGMT